MVLKILASENIDGAEPTLLKHQWVIMSVMKPIPRPPIERFLRADINRHSILFLKNPESH